MGGKAVYWHLVTIGSMPVLNFLYHDDDAVMLLLDSTQTCFSFSWIFLNVTNGWLRWNSLGSEVGAASLLMIALARGSQFCTVKYSSYEYVLA